MNFNVKLLKNKKFLMFTAALVTPGGFIALGLWKAYKVYKKKKEEELQRPQDFEEYVANLKERTESESE